MFSLPASWTRTKAPAPAAADSLDAFFTEDGPPPSAAPAQQRPAAESRRPWLYAASIALVALTGTAAAGVYLLKRAEPVKAAPSAAVTIESDPVGAEVSFAGVAKGVTPLTLSVAPGEHTFEVVHSERRKQVRVSARAETAVVHHVQFDLPAEGQSAGALPKGSASGSVATSGVRTPGSAAGKAPNSTSKPAGPAAGWIAITSSIPLTVMEGGQVIGSTASAKIMVPAGKRDLRFSNESLGFSAGRTVQVSAGKTATISVSVPKAAISINAVPWAEVWIDGVRVGETPIGNYMVPLGARDIVFRHPTLGERRQTATVSMTAPARVSVDMRKQ